MISVSSETRDPKHFEPAVKSGIPVLQFDRIIDSFQSSKILNDDYSGAYNEVTHMINQGYQKIAHFAGPLQLRMYRNRFEGYKQALTDNNLSFSRELIYEGYISYNKGIEGLKKLLHNKQRTDALFAASDMSALGALSVLKENGIKIPAEYGVGGYVNELFSEYIEPALTSTEQFGQEVGKTSARVMIEEIVNDNKAEHKTITIKPQLMIRRSTLRN
jgi:LacI family transcriptional regulator